MKTLAERTEEAIAAGFTVGALAAAAGKTSAAVSLWRAGKTHNIKADSALGLQKLTGWSWTWWVTGEGERGETRSAPDASPMVVALRTLGAALAHDMADEVRQDAADLLAKLALRRGSTRHQAELASLLSPFEAMAVVPTQLGGRVDLDHATSHQLIKHAPAPQILGVDQPNEDRGGKWDLLNVGTPADVARPRGGASRQHKPGEKSPGKASKRPKP